QANGEVSPDATHAAVEENTRMLAPAELPGWKSPVRPRSQSRVLLWTGALVLLLAGAGGAYWYQNQGGPASDKVALNEPGLPCSLELPPGWSRQPPKGDGITFSSGDESSGDWARVNVYANNSPQHSITGLRSGFVDYKEILGKQFKDVEVTGSQRRPLN